MRCDICNGETKIIKAKQYQYSLSGLNNLYIKNIQIEKCNKCNLDIPLIPKILKLHETIARALVLKPSLLISEESRFLRKNLRIKSQDWAKYLRKDVSYISRIENGKEELNKDLDILIRLMYVRLWEEKNEQVFDGKVSELFLQLESKDIEILIDVENIEYFSYREKEQIWADELTSPKFDLANDPNITASFGGESISFDNSSPFSLRELYAENSELALAG